MALTQAPRPGRHRSFLDLPLALDLDRLAADVAILGVPYGLPYSPQEAVNDQANAPTAVRQASYQLSDGPAHWDFDLGATLGDLALRVVDCGDVTADLADPGLHYRNAEAAVAKILAAGALPICVGGDHGIPIPVLRGFAGQAPFHLIHIDAHLDWRDAVNGVREGYSSPIRRASEMPHVDRIWQIGLRGQGSARVEEVQAARAYGSELITAWELQEISMAAVLDRIPDGARYYLTIDADGLDPSAMPAVAAPAPGGVTLHQARQLIHGLARKGRVVGMDIVEITPARDVNEITAIAAGRLILNLIGAVAQAGYFAPGARPTR
jgi:agmatinase